MPEAVTLTLDDRELRRNLRTLSDREAPQAIARALNKTAFEVLEAEKSHVAGAFTFAGAGTRRFLSGRGSFRFRAASTERLEARIFPAPKTERILAQHRAGSVISGEDAGRLTLGDELAVPVDVRRGKTGKVRRAQLPGAIIAKGGRGFVSKSGRAIVQRSGRGKRQRLRVAFALVRRAKLTPVIEFYRVARDTAQREFPRKAREAFARIRLGR